MLLQVHLGVRSQLEEAPHLHPGGVHLGLGPQVVVEGGGALFRLNLKLGEEDAASRVL